MRVLFLVKKFDFGGAENHVRDLANAFADEGIDVTLIAGKGRQTERLNRAVKYLPLKMRDIFLPWHVIYISSLVSRQKINIIHAHQRLPILTASLVSRITGVPVIATVHGYTKGDLRSALSRRVPEKLIFVSEYTFGKASRFSELEDKRLYIPNWIRIMPCPLSNDQNNITYISRIDKNHANLIIRIIKDVIFPLAWEYRALTFRITGDGPCLEDVRKEAEKLNAGLGRHICHLSGFVEDTEEIIKSSGLILGVGRVALEALSGGVPVLSVNRKRLGSLISTGNYEEYRKNNFVSVHSFPPESDLLLRTVKDYLENPDFWKDQAFLVRERIKTDFAPEIHIDRVRMICSEQAVSTNRTYPLMKTFRFLLGKVPSFLQIGQQ